MLKALHKLRGLAALIVALSHLAHWQDIPNLYWKFRIIGLGTQAVCVFFVISGFIIARTHSREVGKIDRLSPYAIKRFLRLYPAYWFYSLLSLSLGALGFWSIDTSNLGHRTPLELISAITLLPISNNQFGFILVSWSLFYEILFYLVFSFFFFGRKYGIAVLFLFIFLSLINHEYWLVKNFCFNHQNLLFLLGVLIGFNFDSLRGLPVPPWLLLAVGASLYLAFVWIGSDKIWPMSYFAATCLVSGAVLLDIRSGNASAPAVPWIEKTLLWFGSISYSLYLCHVPAQAIVFAFFGRPFNSVLALPFFVLTPIAMASLTYLWIEYPMQKLARKLTGKKLQTIPGVSETIAHTP